MRSTLSHRRFRRQTDWYSWAVDSAFRDCVLGRSQGVIYSSLGSNCKQERHCARLLNAALGLVAKYDPRRLERLQKDTRGVLIRRVHWLAHWNDRAGLIELSLWHLFEDYATPEFIAATLVHEAAHAELFRMGIGYEFANIRRVEEICLRAELKFARRLPSGGEQIVAHAEYWLAANDAWTPEWFYRQEMRLMAKYYPRWLAWFLRGWERARWKRERHRLACAAVGQRATC